MRLAPFAALFVALGLGFSACASPVSPPGLQPPPATRTLLPPTPTTTPDLHPDITLERELGCYNGPGEAAVLIATLPQGQKIELLGKDDYGEYWVVIDPGSGIGCWLRREGTRAEGVTDYLPNLVPPPTPFALPPAAPGNLTAVLDSCTRDATRRPVQWTVVILLQWEDNSPDEDYFRVLKTDHPITFLDSDVTQYKDTIKLSGVDSGRARYGLEAYSRDGRFSDRVEVEVEFQCRES